MNPKAVYATYDVAGCANVTLTFNRNTSEERGPTAIVFGWAAAEKRQLEKYSALYRDMRYNTVSLTLPMCVIFSLKFDAVHNFTMSVLQTIFKNVDKSGGLIFHLLSNGGAFCAAAMVESFKQSTNDCFKNCACAFVFDSAPCYPNPDIASKAFATGLISSQRGPMFGMVRLGYTAVCYVKRFVGLDETEWFWNVMSDGDFHCPELYIFSTMDRLLDSDMLQNLVEKRRAKLGDDVHVWMVDDVAHVMMLKQYTNKYRAEIQRVNEWGVNEWRRKHSLPIWSLNHHDGDNEMRGSKL